MRTERGVPPNVDENEALKQSKCVCFLCLNTQKRLGCGSGSVRMKTQAKTGSAAVARHFTASARPLL